MNAKTLLTRRVSIGLSAIAGGAHFSSVAHAEPTTAVVTYDLLVIGAGSGGIACGECNHDPRILYPDVKIMKIVVSKETQTRPCWQKIGTHIWNRFETRYHSSNYLEYIPL